MSYEPTTWESGDVVTSAKLNKIEDGIYSSGALVVSLHAETGQSGNVIVMDKTWQEVHDAMVSGRSVVVSTGNDTAIIAAFYDQSLVGFITECGETIEPMEGEPSYHVTAFGNPFYADAANDYPYITAG